MILDDWYIDDIDACFRFGDHFMGARAIGFFGRGVFFQSWQWLNFETWTDMNWQSSHMFTRIGNVTFFQCFKLNWETFNSQLAEKMGFPTAQIYQIDPNIE